jgi:hypothetical protein
MIKQKCRERGIEPRKARNDAKEEGFEEKLRRGTTAKFAKGRERQECPVWYVRPAISVHCGGL